MSDAAVCDFCGEEKYSTAQTWAGGAQVGLCDECSLFLNTHAKERDAFAQDVEENREP